jgi:hypothetical protein
MTKLKPQQNIWAVRDEAGLVHMAQVLRFFDEVDEHITALQVATACHPSPTLESNVRKLPWFGSQRLPHVDMHDPVTLPGTPIAAKLRFTIVDWNVREIPTCLQCLAVDSFG